MNTIYEKLSKNEVVCLYDDIEDAVFKILPSGGLTVVKYKGGTEYSVKTSTKLVYEAMLKDKIISESEYDKH